MNEWVYRWNGSIRKCQTQGAAIDHPGVLEEIGTTRNSSQCANWEMHLEPSFTLMVSTDSKFQPHITSITKACQLLHKPIRKSSKNIALAHSFHFQPHLYQLQNNWCKTTNSDTFFMGMYKSPYNCRSCTQLHNVKWPDVTCSTLSQCFLVLEVILTLNPYRNISVQNLLTKVRKEFKPHEMYSC
jgi:hypothetical protein